jgi:peptide deformylase
VVCHPVEHFDSAVRDLAEEMIALMVSHSAVGLAAPQVGLRCQILVCGIECQPIVLANAHVHQSAEPGGFVEGCLSLPETGVRVVRPERIRVFGYDVHGQRKRLTATGLWARVIQHEMDHLRGVLICDHGPPAEPSDYCRPSLPTTLVDESPHNPDAQP